jgi:ribA/ribD-fused uncharacterized protein
LLNSHSIGIYRQVVWLNRHKLAGSRYFILEDYPVEITNKRKLLYPAFKAAQRSADFTQVSLTVDRLIVDGQTFTVDNMQQLPDSLQPANTAVVETEDTVVFFTRNAIFSNLHPMAIMIEGQNFSCNEQFYQYRKALFFNDQVAARKIKSETNPYIMMSIARDIKGYKHGVWMKQARKSLMRANEAKYEQHERARLALQATGSKKLGEASSNKVFGTGVGLFSKKAADQNAWSGSNMMGSILEEIRNKMFS